MKFVLLAALSTCLVGNAFAQSENGAFEVAIHGGLSTNTIPHGPSHGYQGERTEWNFNPGVGFRYNVDEFWQAGVDISLNKWETKGDWQLTGPNGLNLGTREVTGVLADPAVCVAFQVNRMLPFYDQYGGFNRSNLYFGLSAGVIVSGNDGKITYDRVSQQTNINEYYTYVSEFHYESGYGYLAGLQLGYTYYVTEHIGINADVAARFASVYTVDPRYGGKNEKFNLFYVPATLGITYRFGYQ